MGMERFADRARALALCTCTTVRTKTDAGSEVMHFFWFCI